MADNKAIADVVEAFRKATVEADRAQLEALTSDEVIYAHTSGRTETKQQFIHGVMSGKSAFSAINVQEQRIVQAGDAAVVHQVVQVERLNPPPGNNTNRMTIMSAWYLGPQGWKLIARQAVKIND